MKSPGVKKYWRALNHDNKQYMMEYVLGKQVQPQDESNLSHVDFNNNSK